MLALTEKLVDTQQAPWNKCNYTVQVTREGAAFRYQTIGFLSFQEAVAAKNDLRKKDLKRHLSLPYQNGQRIDMAKAKRLAGVQ